jgi:hypothetical protein
MAGYGLADAAARIFAEERSSKNPDVEWDPERTNRKSRAFLRHNAVTGRRYLWQTGDAGQRATVAARVLIWMGLPDRVISDRVHARECKRLGEVNYRTPSVSCPVA